MRPYRRNWQGQFTFGKAGRHKPAVAAGFAEWKAALGGKFGVGKHGPEFLKYKPPGPGGRRGWVPTPWVGKPGLPTRRPSIGDVPSHRPPSMRKGPPEVRHQTVRGPIPNPRYMK